MRMCTCTCACQAHVCKARASHMHMYTQTLCEVKRPQETIQSRAVKYDAARKMPPASQQPAHSGEMPEPDAASSEQEH